MEDAPGVQDARNSFWAKNAGGGPLQDYTNHPARFGASGYLAAGTSPTQQFVGSYRVDINVVASKDADYLKFTLTNTTSMTSFLAGQGPNWDRSAFFPTPFGNMKQTYQWVERAR